MDLQLCQVSAGQAEQAVGITGAASLWEANTGHLCLPQRCLDQFPISKGLAD